MSIGKHAASSLACFAATLILGGCQPPPPSSPPEPKAQDPVEQVHWDFQAIHRALEAYRQQNGTFPPGTTWEARAKLVLEGYIDPFPTPPSAIFAKQPMEYRFEPAYDDMDGDPPRDVAIVVWGLRDEVCREYTRRYAGADIPLGIFDYTLAGGKYPGEVFGQEVRTYAIKWQTEAVDDCELNWVVEYR